jgi:hypothetical protein
MVATVGLALTVPDFRRVDVDGGDEGERALLDDDGDGGAFLLDQSDEEVSAQLCEVMTGGG